MYSKKYNATLLFIRELAGVYSKKSVLTAPGIFTKNVYNNYVSEEKRFASESNMPWTVKD